MTKDKAPKLLHRLFALDRTESLKLIVGGFLFFCIVGAYTLTQELKYGVFSTIIGPYYIPAAQLLTFITLFPAIMFDGYLVDRFRRHQLVIFYTSLFGFIGLVFTYFFNHPEIGVGNQVKSPGRIFGWLFFIYVEAFSPFLLGVFWAFMNSIHSPQNAQRTYGFIVSLSKVAGIIMTLLPYLFLSNSSFLTTNINSISKLQLLLVTSSMLLLLASFFLTLITKKVNTDAFKGYHTQIEEKTTKTGIWMGISLLFKNRYVLGIFLLVFLADTITEVLNYKRVLTVVNSKSQHQELDQMIGQLYLQLLYMHLLGLFMSIFLTNSIMRLLSIKICTFIMPISTLIFTLAYIVTGFDGIMIWLYIVIKAMYYTIGAPIRESLYIVTSKDIQFKAKFVIDALGIKLARNTGQALNYASNIMNKHYGPILAMSVINSLFIFMIVIWIITAYFVGSTYSKTIKKNQIIT
ncbi:hypothetical protein EDM53_05025 [Rickettsiales endosymbiont of Peranema trichophorum]|nr:hypothetical protein EDM53_05025 [Rickettsiales endosymbiont of Peranema trichophorum]